MKSTLIILTSPPASGKTFWIESFAQHLNPDELIVISPLRALVNECQTKWNGQVNVMTPEEWLIKEEKKKVVIFDEAHLLFYWGDSFRQRMWEAFYGLCAEAELVILLTATLPEWMKEAFGKMNHFDEITWVDQGNQILRYDPETYLKVPSLVWMKDFILCQKEHGTSLIFCAYREEVAKVTQWLTKENFKVLSCVGGEAEAFSKELSKESAPDFIVATTVLSHGVNLPEINRVYFFYPIKNQDFWIQMTARGGRKGKPYHVMGLENPYGIKWNPMRNFLAILWLSLKMRFILSLRQQWFLKE